MAEAYVDTSALLKAYVSESGSDAFVTWMESQVAPCISPLSVVEMRSAIARLTRAGSLSKRSAASALADFDGERRRARYRELNWPGAAFALAVRLIGAVEPLPLRTLDALHLAVARHFECSAFATADRVQADAAHRLGFLVVPFPS